MMNSKWINYLKNNGLSEPSEVDSLFVSSFVQAKGLIVERCSVIKNLLGYDENSVSEFIRILKDDGIYLNLSSLLLTGL